MRERERERESLCQEEIIDVDRTRKMINRDSMSRAISVRGNNWNSLSRRRLFDQLL